MNSTQLSVELLQRYSSSIAVFPSHLAPIGEKLIWEVLVLQECRNRSQNGSIQVVQRAHVVI